MALTSIFVGGYVVDPKSTDAVLSPVAPILVNPGWSSDSFTECIILSGTIAPKPSLVGYLIDPMVIVTNDSCGTLKETITSTAGNLPHWNTYRRHMLGSVPLTTLALAIFGFDATRLLFALLSAASLLSVAAAALMRLHSASFRAAAVVLIAGVAVGGGFSAFCENFGHGPPFFVGMFGLSVMLATYSCAVRQSVAIAFAVLGVMTLYFDLLLGAIPFVFAIAVFMHLLMWFDKCGGPRGLLETASSLMVAGAAYACGIILPLGLKIIILQYGLNYSDTVEVFYGQLAWRLSNDYVGATGIMGIRNVIVRLWEGRSLVFFGGTTVATIFYHVGLASWAVALVLTAGTWLRRRQAADLMALAPPLMGVGVVVVWFLLFTSHGFVHSWFMTRVMSLVPTMGMAALVLAHSRWLLAGVATSAIRDDVGRPVTSP